MKDDVTNVRVGRRGFLAGASAVAGALALPRESAALTNGGQSSSGGGPDSEVFVKKVTPVPAPVPIPGGIDLSVLGLSPPYDFIHWFPPGPAGQVLPHTGVQLADLDCERSTITHFYGDVAMAYLIGEAKGCDGILYPLEVDVRVMEGWYCDTDGEIQYGTFCLI